MTDATVVKRLLERILARNDDLVLRGNRLVLVPMGHSIRDVEIVSLETGSFINSAWGFQPLWVLDTASTIWSFLNIESRERRLVLRSEGCATTEEMRSEAYYSEINEIALPFLRSIGSIEKLYNVAKDPGILTHQDAFIYFYMELAIGNFDEAASLLNLHRREWLHDASYYCYWSRRDVLDDLRLRRLERILEGKTYDQLPDLLRKWERRMMRRIGLTEFWKPAPFPFEMR